jgi:hypothetical protein
MRQEKRDLGRHWTGIRAAGAHTGDSWLPSPPNYYQRSAGEVALAALPPQLRDLSARQTAAPAAAQARPPPRAAWAPPADARAKVSR